MPGMMTRLKEMVARLTGKAVVQAVQEYIAPVSEVLVGLHTDLERHRAETDKLHERTAELHQRTAELQDRTAALQQQLEHGDSMLARAEAMLTEVRAMHSDAARRIRLHMWLMCLGGLAALAAIVLSLVALGR